MWSRVYGITEINSGFIQLMSAGNEDITGFQESQTFLDNELATSLLQAKGGFNIRQLGKDYCFDDDYVATHKLCSKLMCFSVKR